MKNKKAFTLAETVVTLSVLSIVLILVASMVLMIARSTQKQQYDSRCVQEYTHANSLISEFFSTYSVDGCNLYSIENNAVTVNFNEDNFVIEFNLYQQKLTSAIKNYQTSQVETKEIFFENLIEISFTAQNNIVKCEYKFENFATYTDIFKFGVF